MQNIQRQTLKVIKDAQTAFQKIKKQVITNNNKKLASKAQPTYIKLFISSHPNRAKIFVDGVWDLKRTPRQISFHEGQTILLKSKGYKDYTLSEKDIRDAFVDNNQIFIILRKE